MRFEIRALDMLLAIFEPELEAADPKGFCAEALLNPDPPHPEWLQLFLLW
jgi:hypothetical protein